VSRVTESRRRRIQAMLASALALAVAACGSTVAASSQQGGAGLSAPGSSGPTNAAGGNGAGQPGGLSAQAGGAQFTAAPGVATSGGQDAAAGGNPQRAVGSSISGPISLGFIAGKCSNCSSLGTAYTPPSYSDQQFEQAMVNAINAHGGIAGRKIAPVFAVVDTASTNWATDYQAACSTFTQDHHVVAVLGYSFAYENNLGACLAKAGVLWINGGYGVGDAQILKQPLYFSNTAPSEDAELLTSLSSAVDDGWVTTKSTLGILQANCDTDARAFRNTLMPYIAAHHLNLKDNETVNCVQGASDDGNVAAFIEHAQLQMRTDGVDSIIITGIPLILFAEDAESQQWHPHYLAYLGGAAYEPYLGADQLENIHATGWLPTLDINATHVKLSAQQQACSQLLRQGGVAAPPSQYTPAFIACDSVLLYAYAVEQAHGLTSPVAVAQALEGLNSSYVSAVTLNGQTSFTATHKGAPGTYRVNLYQSSCSCFQYVGPVHQFAIP
jgi:ABC-type branched-subunit amino acid transport system substrate-binding protein